MRFGGYENMRFGGYKIGDKIIYTNSFTKPTLGKVVYYINGNYLVDLSDNTRRWATDRELKRYGEKNDYLNVVNKYVKGRKYRCIKDYIFDDSISEGAFIEIIPTNTEFTIDILFSYTKIVPINEYATIIYVALRPIAWKPKYETNILGGTISIVWEDFVKYFELVK
nr:MAG TPA_asm: hypothetical protein [Caudoviricetes sp.]